MQTVVFHGFAHTRCTASFQPFCGMSAIKYNVLNDRVFPQSESRFYPEYGSWNGYSGQKGNPIGS